MAPPTGTPSPGAWARDGTGPTLVDEGHPNRVDILSHLRG